MLLRLIKYFRGYVEVALWGYAPERFLNLCSNHNILIWDLHQEGDVYYFHISVDGFRSLKPLLKKRDSILFLPLSQTEDPVFERFYLYDDSVYLVAIYLEDSYQWKRQRNGRQSAAVPCRKKQLLWDAGIQNRLYKAGRRNQKLL